MIATALAWSWSLSGAPLAAADAVAAAVGAQALGRPVVAPSSAREVAPAEGGVLLNVGAILTTSAEAAALRASVGWFEGKRLHLVQFAGPTRPDWYEDLEATGADVIQYIPSFTYLVYGDAPALARVREMAQSSSAVRWEGAYLDAYKVQLAAQPETRVRLGLPADQDAFAIQLVADPAANGETVRLVESWAVGAVLQRWEILKYLNLVVTLPVDAVDEIAARPDVVSIDRYVTPQMLDERQDRILSGQLTGNGPTPGDYLAYLAGKGFTQAQFDASGFVVDVSDSGIDNATTTPNHFGLRVGGDLANPGRVQYNRLEGTSHGGGPQALQGCDGHGNLNAHIVAGYVPDPATLPVPGIHADASAFRYGLGVAPFVKVGSSIVFDPTEFTNPNVPNLQARAYSDNARISTNSWGAITWGAPYELYAQTFDALVRDAQPATSVLPTAGNQEMVVVFAAGNLGPDSITLTPPGTAKNVITVGAAEGVQAFNGADGCSIADAGADSANDMATSSSHGPTHDGRVKPDVVAPGTHISGGVFQAAASVAGTGDANWCFTGNDVCGGLPPSKFFPAWQEFYTASSGTSHATPAVAGGAALLRQHFINNGLTPPSPAMTKALLVNSARYMNGLLANDTLPSNSQGTGMMDLDTYFNQMAGARLLRDQVPADMFTASGQWRVVTGNLTDVSKPFRVTLAWTDAPGSTTGNAYVNDLDLEVTVGGHTYKGNVFDGASSVTGGLADRRNNVESVFLPAGASGPFSVKVIATNIAGDGVPNVGGALDQDYALVIANSAPATQPVIAAGTATVGTDSCGGGNGVLDPGETATLSLCVHNTGAADATAAMGTLQLAGGVTSPSGPQAYGVLVAGGAPVCRSFAFTVDDLACGGTVTPTLQVQDGGTDLGHVSWTFRTGTPVMLLAEGFDGVTAPALPGGWTTTHELATGRWETTTFEPDTAPNAARSIYGGGASLNSLVTPGLSVPTTGDPIVLSFRHNHNVHWGRNGGVLEMKVGAGPFQDILSAGGSFVTGGYNGTLGEFSPLEGRQAWSGDSGRHIATTVNLPASVSGQTIQLRWRLGEDGVTYGDAFGWRVDTISLQAGWACCAPSPTCTSFSISPLSASPDAQAGSQVVTITGVPAGCIGGDWTTSGNGSWITVSPASGSGPGSATVSWTQNTGAERAGSAMIAGQVFTVTQAGPGTSGSDFFTIPPCRLIDTRVAGPFGGPIVFGTSRTIPVAGVCGVSVSAKAVALNLTVAAPTAAGNCRLYPDAGARPLVSNINYAADQTRANNAVVPLGPGGTVTVYCVGAGPGSLHLVLDVNGYFE